jgi:hypothetical protein
VSNYCRDWEAASGACTSCYDGYELQSGVCAAPAENTTQCYYRQVPKNGSCVDISDQCKTWDVITGDCLSCFDGYTLANGACTL